MDGATDQLFRSMFSGLVQMSDYKKQWTANQMSFSVNVGVGGLRSPVSGTILVTDTEITIDCVLPPLIESLASDSVKAHVQGAIRGLLT